MYYAFFTWGKKAPAHDGVVTMHMKTSAIAMNMMLIHAIVIETIGIHWWLHEKSIWISIVLLVLNIYSVIFFLAETQVIRLNPIEIKEGKLYAAQGLTKRIIVPLEKIKEVKWGAKPHKEALEFILRDFEPLEAHVVITLREPLEATMFMGRKKAVTELALRVDEPEKLKQLLQINNS
jgi:membrane protein YdbS with pleckstrin-like domain